MNKKIQCLVSSKNTNFITNEEILTDFKNKINKNDNDTNEIFYGV